MKLPEQEESSQEDRLHVAALIVDYVAVCERRRELLDWEEFIKLWREADGIARESVRR